MFEIFDISSMSNEEIENGHDWVQRAFPTDRRSTVTSDIFQVDSLKATLLIKDDKFIQVLRVNTKRFLEFFNSHPKAVTATYNHNYQRVTRVIECLVLFGLRNEAVVFCSNVRKAFLRRNLSLPISDITYWQPALALLPSLNKRWIPTGLPSRLEVPNLKIIGSSLFAKKISGALAADRVNEILDYGKLGEFSAVVFCFVTSGSGWRYDANDNNLKIAVSQFGSHVKDQLHRIVFENFIDGILPQGEYLMLKAYECNRTGWIIFVAGLSEEPYQQLRNLFEISAYSGLDTLYMPILGEKDTKKVHSLENLQLTYVQAYDAADIALFSE